MAGKVKAVTKELEPEDSFKILVVGYKATLSSKAEVLLEIRSCLT